MDHFVTSQIADELRREAATRKLTTLLASYRTNDLEAFVDLLVQQHQAIQAACDTADPSLISTFFTEE